MSKVVAQLLRAPAGGIRKHVLDIIESLESNELPQVLVTNLHDADIDLSYLKSKVNVKVFHLDIKESPGFSDLRNILSLYQICRRENIKVLHGHGAKGGLYARILSVLLRIPCLYTPHGGSLHRVHGKIKNAIYDSIEKILTKFTNVFLFESNYTMKMFQENVGTDENKFIVNYNGVSLPEKFSELSYTPGTKISLSSFGLLRHLKGHDIIIEACKLLKQKNISFHYTIYGDGDFESHLKDLIKKYDLISEVDIKNYSGNVLAEMLKYHVVIHPSRFESFGYVPVEAMSLKVPVITSFEGGLKEVADDETAFIAYNNKPSEYLAFIQDFYSGKLQVNSKVEKAYQKVEKLFSKSAMVSEIKRIYLSL